MEELTSSRGHRARRLLALMRRDIPAAVLVTALSTFVSDMLFGRVLIPDVVMTYLLGVIVVSALFRPAAAIVAALLSVAAFDYFFVPPYLSLRVSDPRNFGTFGIMVVIALVTSALVQRVRAQSEAATRQALRTLLLEAQSKELAHEAELERLHSSLLSSISHDLRGPLAVIVGSTSTVLDDERILSVETRRELIASARAEAERMNELIERLVKSTRLASGGLEAERSWYLIQDVVSLAVNRVGALRRGLRVHVSVGEDVPAVLIDAVLMEQVFVNLLENAIKYAPDSDIDISARLDLGAQTVELEIADRGPGIPAADRERVFEKFTRLPRETKGGAGLGLAVCRGIIAAHGGTIRVDARPGGGSSFRISLPAATRPDTSEDDRR